jgi:hypothetical protein
VFTGRVIGVVLVQQCQFVLSAAPRNYVGAESLNGWGSPHQEATFLDVRLEDRAGDPETSARPNHENHGAQQSARQARDGLRVLSRDVAG